jgi:hypothetical protein
MMPEVVMLDDGWAIGRPVLKDLAAFPVTCRRQILFDPMFLEQQQVL